MEIRLLQVNLSVVLINELCKHSIYSNIKLKKKKQTLKLKTNESNLIIKLLTANKIIILSGI